MIRFVTCVAGGCGGWRRSSAVCRRKSNTAAEIADRGSFNSVEHGERVLRRGGLGTVGPEAITSSGSPSTSEMISADEPAGTARPREPAALDAAELLADRVELLDVGAGRAEEPGDAHLVGQRDPAPAAGSSAEPPPEMTQRQRSSGAERGDEFQDLLRPRPRPRAAAR